MILYRSLLFIISKHSISEVSIASWGLHFLLKAPGESSPSFSLPSKGTVINFILLRSSELCCFNKEMVTCSPGPSVTLQQWEVGGAGREGVLLPWALLGTRKSRAGGCQKTAVAQQTGAEFLTVRCMGGSAFSIVLIYSV